MRRKKESHDKVFTSMDAYLSGFLTLKGFIPELIKQGEKIVFTFDASEDLYQTIAEYNKGARVEALQLALTTKVLKSQIHSLRRKKNISL